MYVTTENTLTSKVKWYSTPVVFHINYYVKEC